jgi:hypothetical protein
VSYARLVVENAMKYGLLLSLPPLNMAEWPKTWPCLSMTVTLIFAAPFAAFSVERAADNGMSILLRSDARGEAATVL